MQTASKKVIHSWAMYDWANSVYSLVITSTIFPAFYEAVTSDGNEQTLIDKGRGRASTPEVLVVDIR